MIHGTSLETVVQKLSWQLQNEKQSRREHCKKWNMASFPMFPMAIYIDKCQTEGEAELNKSCSWLMDSHQNGKVSSCYDNINAVCLIKTVEFHWQLAQNVASWQSRRETSSCRPSLKTCQSSSFLLPRLLPLQWSCCRGSWTLHRIQIYKGLA
mgnify:CR=1 FL=1